MVARNRQRGFALILTLALVGMLCIGLTAFVQSLRYALRSLEEDRQRARAEDLVRYGLDRAMAELRMAMGATVDELGPVVTLYQEDGGLRGLRVWKRSADGLVHVDLEPYTGSIDETEGHDHWKGDYTYSIQPYVNMDERHLPPAGVVLADVARGGLRMDLKRRLNPPNELEPRCLWEREDSYGPLESVLASYVKMVRDLDQQEKEGIALSLTPRGHGLLGADSEDFLPMEGYQPASFFKSNPFKQKQSVPTRRGDPANFALYPWIVEASMQYALEVQRSSIKDLYDLYLRLRPTIVLYNPYDVGLNDVEYVFSSENAAFSIKALAGGLQLKKDNETVVWAFSTSLKPGEKKEVVLDEQRRSWVSVDGQLSDLQVFIREFLGDGLSAHRSRDNALVFSAGVGELRQAFQRITSPRWSVQDALGGTSFGLGDWTEFKVNESLSVLSSHGNAVPLFTMQYRPSVPLADWGAPSLVQHEAATAPLSVPEKASISLPTSIDSVADLMPGVQRYFDGFALTPISVELHEDECARDWRRFANEFFWDGAYYQGKACSLIPYPFLEGAHDTGVAHVESYLLVETMNVNETSPARWAQFLKQHCSDAFPVAKIDVWDRLGLEISRIVKERTEQRVVADFLSPSTGAQGVLVPALRTLGLEEKVSYDQLLKCIGGRLVAREDAFKIVLSSEVSNSSASAEALVQGVLRERDGPNGERGLSYELDIVAFRWLNKSSLFREKKAADQ